MDEKNIPAWEYDLQDNPKIPKSLIENFRLDPLSQALVFKHLAFVTHSESQLFPLNVFNIETGRLVRTYTPDFCSSIWNKNLCSEETRNFTGHQLLSVTQCRNICVFFVKSPFPGLQSNGQAIMKQTIFSFLFLANQAEDLHESKAAINVYNSGLISDILAENCSSEIHDNLLVFSIVQQQEGGVNGKVATIFCSDINIEFAKLSQVVNPMHAAQCGIMKYQELIIPQVYRVALYKKRINTLELHKKAKKPQRKIKKPRFKIKKPRFRIKKPRFKINKKIAICPRLNF